MQKDATNLFHRCSSWLRFLQRKKIITLFQISIMHPKDKRKRKQKMYMTQTQMFYHPWKSKWAQCPCWVVEGLTSFHKSFRINYGTSTVDSLGWRVIDIHAGRIMFECLSAGRLSTQTRQVGHCSLPDYRVNIPLASYPSLYDTNQPFEWTLGSKLFSVL